MLKSFKEIEIGQTQVRKQERKSPKGKRSIMDECILVAGQEGDQPGGKVDIATALLKSFLFQPWHEVYGRVHSRPCYRSKSETWTKDFLGSSYY